MRTAAAGLDATPGIRKRVPLAVALVGPLPPPAGGMANQTRQLALLLESEGCRVIIVQVNAPYRPAWVERLRGARAIARLVPYVFELWRAVRNADVVHVMANSGWAWHFCAAPAIWVAHLQEKPVIVNYRGGGAAAFFARQFGWVRPTLARATTVVVPSGYLQDVFARWRVATEIVPNIVDTSRFRPGERPAGPPHLIVARNLENIYDIGTALRAFAKIRVQYPEARLTVAGEGPCGPKLIALCDVLRIAPSVTFTGRLPNDGIAELYREADLVLNPSLVDNMPISLLEAMASGVPIVSTNVGGIPHLVDDGKTALLVPPSDPDAMAAAALRVLGDPSLSARMQADGLIAAQRYTWPGVRGRLFDVYWRARGDVGSESQAVAARGRH